MAAPMSTKSEVASQPDAAEASAVREGPPPSFEEAVAAGAREGATVDTAAAGAVSTVEDAKSNYSKVVEFFTLESNAELLQSVEVNVERAKITEIEALFAYGMRRDGKDAAMLQRHAQAADPLIKKLGDGDAGYEKVNPILAERVRNAKKFK